MNFFVQRSELRELYDKVAAGELGMKTGQGFRPWTDETAKRAHARLADHLIAALAAGEPPPATPTTT